MRFTLSLATDNAAFDGENLRPELSRILRRVADDIDGGGTIATFQTIHDANGNDVGRYAVKRDDGTTPNL